MNVNVPVNLPGALAFFRRAFFRILLPVACGLLPLMTCVPAQAKMVADTVVLAVLSNGVSGASGEYIVLYNPTPDTVNLQNDTIGGPSNGVAAMPSVTIGPFDFFTIGDALGIPVDHVDPIALLSPINYTELGSTTAGAAFDSVGVNVGYMIVRKPSTRHLIARFLDDDTNTTWDTFAADVGDSYIFTRYDTASFTTPPAQPMFVCSGPASAIQGENFSISCTLVIRLGPNTNYDSVVPQYTGSLAWADMTSNIGTLNGLSVDSRFTSGALNNYSINISGATGDARIIMTDAFCTGYTIVTITAAGDTLDIVNFTGAQTAGSTNRHETTARVVTITGRSSGDSMFINGSVNNDTVAVRVNNVRDTIIFHSSGNADVTTDTGNWRMQVALRETLGETLSFSLFRYPVVNDDNETTTASETLVLVYDVTQAPKLRIITDTLLSNGDIVDSVTHTVEFVVNDTGAGLNSNGSCTFWWHIDQSPDSKDYTTVTEFDSGRGDYVIRATMYLNSVSVDTKVGFWLECYDDVYNGTSVIASSLTGPAYTAADPGTFTIEIANVRDIVISEIMADGDTGEYIELYNTTGTAMNMNGWTLRDRAGNAAEAGAGFIAQFGPEDTIAAYGYFIVGPATLRSTIMSDPDNHDSFTVQGGGALDGWNGDDLGVDPETLSLKTASGTEIDSTDIVAEYNVIDGGNNDTPNATSMERILRWSGGRLRANYADSVSGEWDTNNGHSGQGGRWRGTPGHANSINIPFVDTVTPNNVVQASGRGEWDITVHNGKNAFTSNGNIVVQVPQLWSAPTTTSNNPGYVTIKSEDSGASGGALTTSGRSFTYNVSAFPPLARVTFTYGDYGNAAHTVRNSLARVDTEGIDVFQLFFDTDGSSYEQVGESINVSSWGPRVDSITIVRFDTYVLDTNPATNPQTFINGQYELTVTISDSLSRKVYGAHITADTLAPGGADPGAYDDTMYPHLSEYSAFTGFYQTAGTDSTITGWTNSSGEFTFTIKISETEGANIVHLKDTDWEGTATRIYIDSARLPNPVINEVGWDGNAEWIELYNPTHQIQNVYNWHIRSYDALSGTGIRVDSGHFRFIDTIPPFTYLVLPETIGTVGDSAFNNPPSPFGGTRDSTISVVNNMFTDGTRDSIQLRSDTGLVDLVVKTTGEAWWNDAPAGDGNGAPDKGAGASLERMWPNRSGNISGAWATAGSDSALRLNGFGSPGRPNASALSAYTGNFMDKRDTYVRAYDTALIYFTMRISSGDTQPFQQFGVRSVWTVMNKPARDTGVTNGDTTSGRTDTYGQSYFNIRQDSGQNGIDSYAHAVSGTLQIRVVMPFGIPDTEYIVFDRGDSFGYTFVKSETNITFQSADSDLLVRVGISDTYSGLRYGQTTAVYETPLLRWKFHKVGAWTPWDTMSRDPTNRIPGDTSYYYRIIIGNTNIAGQSNPYAGANYNDSSYDTLVWQITARDQAGNYDTSVDTWPMLNSPPWDSGFEYIEPNDTVTIVTPSRGDTVGGRRAWFVFRLRFSTATSCTTFIEFDSDATGAFMDSVTFYTLEGGIFNYGADAAGNTTPILTCDYLSNKTYTGKWNVRRDIPDTNTPNARIRIRCWNAQTGANLGDTIMSPVGIQTVLPDPADTPAGRTYLGRIATSGPADTVRLTWYSDSLAKYFIIFRDSGNVKSGNMPNIPNDTERFINVCTMVVGAESIPDNLLWNSNVGQLTFVDTHIDTPYTSRSPKIDTYHVWYIMAVDTWDNIHELPYGYGDSVGAEFVSVSKYTDSVSTKNARPWDTIPGAQLIYVITIGNTEGYSPAYNVKVIDYVPVLTDYLGTNVEVDTLYGYDTQTDIDDPSIDYTKYISAGDSQYIHVDLPNPFNPGDTARIRFRVVIR